MIRSLLRRLRREPVVVALDDRVCRLCAVILSVHGEQAYYLHRVRGHGEGGA